MAVRAGDGRIHSMLLRSSPRRLLASAGVLLLAGAGLLGSGAAFNGTSANTLGVVTTGILRQSNSKSGTAVLSAANMAPGATATGTLDLGNTGTLASIDSVTTGNLVDTPASPAFSSYLQLKVEDLGSPTCTTCPTPVVLYTGTLRGSVGTNDLATFAPGDKHRYRFTITYPNGGAGGADNAYGGAKSSVDITWGARQ
jgi:spore coat-associated protein N